jgi:hypothetical protein
MIDEGASGKNRPRTGSDEDAARAEPGKERPDDELDPEVVAELRRSYNPPPKPPLDAIWRKVEQGRAEKPADEIIESDNVLSIVKDADDAAPRRRKVNGPSESEGLPPKQALKRIVDQ